MSSGKEATAKLFFTQKRRDRRNWPGIMEPNTTLKDLNDEKALMFLPIIIFLFLLMVAGIIGNLLVCYVYYSRFVKMASHWFILWMAILDLINCCVGIPFEIVDLRNPYTFKMAAMCKMMRFTESLSCISSGFVLVFVAFYRYYKICRPLKRFSVRHAKTLCGVSLVLGLCLSWPCLFLFGNTTLQLTPTLKGSGCSKDDRLKNSILHEVYYIILSIAFAVTFSAFIGFYICIGYKLWKRRRLVIGDQYPGIEIPITVEQTQNSSSAQENNCACQESNQRMTNACNVTDTVRRSRANQIRISRMTLVFGIVTTSFFISFLPYLTVNILKGAHLAWQKFYSEAEEVLYNFLVRSYFLNSCVNPFIYSIFNASFRKECSTIFKYLYNDWICWRR